MYYPTLKKEPDTDLISNTNNLNELTKFCEQLQTILEEANLPFGIIDYSEQSGPTQMLRELCVYLDTITFNISQKQANKLPLFQFNTITFTSSSNLAYYNKPNYHFTVNCYQVNNIKEYPIHKKLEPVPKEWQNLKAVELNLQESIKHSVGVYKTKDALLVFTNKITDQMFFKLKALQWSIFKDECLTYNQDVQNFYTSIVTNNAELCNQSIKNIFNMPIWNELRYASLKGKFKSLKEKELSRLQARLLDTKAIVKQHEYEFIASLNNLEHIQEEYFLWEQKEDAINTDEIIEYLIKHPYIKSVIPNSNNSNQLWVYIEAPILYYDEDIIKCLRGLSTLEKKLLKEIFLEKKYILWTRCKINLDVSTFNTFATTIGKNNYLIGHPHIDAYECLGNHPSAIRAWIENQDYIGCFEQIVAMAFNLNFTDSIVINKMWDNLEDNADIPTFQVTDTEEFISYNKIKRRTENESTENNTTRTDTSDFGSNTEN